MSLARELRRPWATASWLGTFRWHGCGVVICVGVCAAGGEFSQERENGEGTSILRVEDDNG